MQLLTIIVSALAAPIVRTLPASVATIHVDVPRGDLTVRHDPSATHTRLTVTPMSWGASCGLQLSGDHEHATARIVHDTGMAGLSCRSRVELTIAGETDLNARLNAGNINTSPTPGHQDLSVGTGRITGSLGTGWVRVDQGRVTLDGLRDELDVAVNVGNVRLDYITAPTGPLYARADMGNVTVTLPADAAVTPAVRSAVGLREQHFTAVADGVAVNVESQIGNARLLAAQRSSADSQSTEP